MNRQTALATGATYYEAGKPCRRGHTGPRYAKTGHCVECLKSVRLENVRLHNTAMATRAEGSSLFAYKLHPDDHAAALAFCQGLDLQRGRQPADRAALEAPPPDNRPYVLPDWLVQARAGLAAAYPPGLAHDTSSHDEARERLRNRNT